jgi:hypothetical protein
MKTLKFGCPFCAQSLEVEKTRRGEAMNCPACNKAVVIPRKRPRAFAYFITGVIGMVIVAALAATVMIIYILNFPPGTGTSARPFTTDVDSLSPLDKLKYDAKRGDAASQCALGLKYFKGEGVACDTGKAVEWFEKAADSGFTQAQAALGLIYCRGEGVLKDIQKAEKWLKMAADNGHAPSQNNLGVLYETGDGVAKNSDKALEYYTAASVQGDQDARANLIRLNKATLNEALNGYDNGQYIPQLFFDAIHPVGKAKSMNVERISFDGNNNKIIILSLLWEGPIIINGYTHIQISMDDQGLNGFEILDTNGITKNDLKTAGEEFWKGLFGVN